MTTMKQRYTIGNYVTISRFDKQGDTTTTLGDAEMPLKVAIGKELRVRPCEKDAERVNLGVVNKVRNYKKRNHIEVLTDNGWYAIDVNGGLESVMTDFIDI